MTQGQPGQRYKDTQQLVAELAAKSFQHHVLTEVRPWVWKVAQPDRWWYGFFLLIAPGAVIVYGDIDAAVFRMSNGPEESVLKWLLGSASGEHPDYVLSKLELKEAYREFYPGDVVAYAQQELEDVLKEVEGSARASDAIRVRDAQELYDQLRDEDAEGDLTSYRFYEIANDRDLPLVDLPNFEKWGGQAFWKWEALKTFVRLYRAKEAEGGAEDAARACSERKDQP